MHTEKEIARFWAKVENGEPNQCWPWTAGRFQRGYGAFGYGGKKPGYAHRFSYELHYGSIPPGKVVMHLCDNRACVNPHHLKLGTQRDNIHDAINKDRWMTPERMKHLNKVSEWERQKDGRWCNR